MADIKKYIRTLKDNGDVVLSNLLDSVTGEAVEYIKVQNPVGITPDGVIYKQLDTAEFGTEIFKRIFYGYANVKWFGAKGDGVTDDTLAINKALATNRKVEFDAGIYRTTQEIIVPNFCQIIGTGNSWTAGTNDTVILYDGTINTNISVIRASTSAVGVQPSSALTNISIKNITINGNAKAGYGFYAAYVTNDSNFEDLTATNCTQHGINIERVWYASFRNIVARSNYGCGITIGLRGWGGVNGVYFSNLRAAANGRDLTFNETTNKEWGYGVGLYTGADLKIRNITSEGNDGAGIVFSSQTEIVGVDGAYLESNCPRGTKDWGIIYVGKSNGRGHFLRNIYCHGATGHLNPQTIWITGVKPAVPVELDTIQYGRIVADHNGYTLSNVSFLVADYIEGVLPQNSKVNGSYGLNTLYIRSTGSDNNDGRTIATAFLTLEKALEVANVALLVTTIDCDSVTLNAPTLDLKDYNKVLTINGNGTSIINNTISGQGLTINNNKNLLVITGFSKVTRLFINNSRLIRIESCSILPDDANSNPAVNLLNSDMLIKTCGIDGTQSTAGTKSGIRLVNSNLRINTSTVTNFSTTRFFRIVENSQILSDINHVRFVDTFWEDSSGVIITPNNTRTILGTSNMISIYSGTTVQRPVGVPIGYIYFDTNLGYQINWNGTNWVNSSGTIV